MVRRSRHCSRSEDWGRFLQSVVFITDGQLPTIRVPGDTHSGLVFDDSDSPDKFACVCIPDSQGVVLTSVCRFGISILSSDSRQQTAAGTPVDSEHMPAPFIKPMEEFTVVVPELGSSIIRSRCELCPVGTPRDLIHRTRVPFEQMRRYAVARPQPDCAVFATRGQSFPVWMPNHGPNRLRMSDKNMQQHEGRRVVDADMIRLGDREERLVGVPRGATE